VCFEDPKLGFGDIFALWEHLESNLTSKLRPTGSPSESDPAILGKIGANIKLKNGVGLHKIVPGDIFALWEHRESNLTSKPRPTGFPGESDGAILGKMRAKIELKNAVGLPKIVPSDGFDTKAGFW